METAQRLQFAQRRRMVPLVSLSFANVMRALLAGYAGSKSDFAREAEIAPSVLSRLLGGGLPPPTDVCLRIARTAGASPSLVLRAADRGHIADAIEAMYGKPRVVRPEGTAEDRALFAELQSLDAPARRAIRTLITYHHAAVTPDVRPAARRRASVRKTRRSEAAEKQTA